MKKPTDPAEESLWQEIGYRIQIVRDIRGITQDQLAALVNMSRTSITNIEAGRQGINLIQAARIAQVEWARLAGKFTKDAMQARDNALEEAAKIARKCGNDDIAREIRALKTNKGA